MRLDLAVMLGHDVRNRIADSTILNILRQPRLRLRILEDGVLLLQRCRTVIQIGGIACVFRLSGFGQLHKLEHLAHDAAAAVGKNVPILYGVFNIEQQPGILARVVFVNQDRAAL